MKNSDNSSKKTGELQQKIRQILYKFNIQKKLNFGQAIYIIGNIKELGKWNIDSAIRL
jgi:hypothetical protein